MAVTGRLFCPGRTRSDAIGRHSYVDLSERDFAELALGTGDSVIVETRGRVQLARGVVEIDRQGRRAVRVESDVPTHVLVRKAS